MILEQTERITYSAARYLQTEDGDERPWLWIDRWNPRWTTEAEAQDMVNAKNKMLAEGESKYFVIREYIKTTVEQIRPLERTD